MVDVKVDVDYSTLTEAEREEALGEAYKAHDYKLMRVIVTASQKAEDVAKKAAKDALQAQLAQLTGEVMSTIKKATQKLYDSGKLDGADGIWYAWDFGSTEASCRLTKSAPRKAGEGVSSGKSSYVAGLPPSAEMLNKVGDEVYFSEDTKVTINKVDQVMPAGMTYKEAYDFSTNGGWRNRVRMALGKAIKEA